MKSTILCLVSLCLNATATKLANVKLTYLFYSILFILPVLAQGQISQQEREKIEFLRAQQGINKDNPNGKQILNSGLELIPQFQNKIQPKKPLPIDERCGFVQAEQMIKEKFPNRNNVDQFEKWMEKAKTVVQNEGKKRDVVTIPVVVHIIEGGPIDISDAQVQSQIDALTEDFRRMNADASNTPGDFAGVASDAEIEFCLATVDPDGNATNGINRWDGGQSSYSIGDMDGVVKPTTIWHPDFYFNIWCAPLQGGLLGYAQFPSSSTLPGFDEDEGPSYTDGIVTRDFAFGVGGSAEAPFNLGRTTTHEAGHFFGLRHIGGDGGCGADDFCVDTPTQNGQNNNGEADCSYPATNSCDDGVGDLPDQFMNYMDYSDDACMNLFTQDQKGRMDVVLSLSPRRASLVNSMVCNGVAPDYPYDPFANAPENDLCAGAIPIECGDEVEGSTSSASPLEQPQACAPEPEAPGVWYSIVGDGNTLTASLCGGTTYDSKIGIYSGPCDDLTCEGGDDDGCGGTGVPSEVSIATTAGETYFIFVTGWNGSTGSFTLQVTCDDTPPPTGPENDFCEGAIAVACGESVEGTTVGAIQDISGTCGTAISAPGVWYSFTGTGEFVTASLCDQANYDTKINIIEAIDCDSDLFCVGGNDDGPGCGGFTSEVQFFGEDGVNYFIYVNGFLGQTGDFTLSVSCDPPAANDLCEDAIALDCDSSVDGSTVFSTAADAVGDTDCEEDPFSNLLGPGVWYTIEGTGGEIILSTCASANYDTKLDVYIGECGALECYAGNDDGPGCPGFTSELQFSTDLGVTYFVYVSGYSDAFFGTSVGDFTLNVDCVCIADAGECTTVYYGYEPAACTDLTASIAYGVGPYTYEWSNGMTGETITVCPSESTTYTVVITDAEGCVAEADVYVDVIDVTCGNNGNKVEICHAPGGNVNKAKTLCISADDIMEHLCHGDALGSCESVVICGEPFSCGNAGGQGMSSNTVGNRSIEEVNWQMSPNPSTGQLYLSLEGHEGKSISIQIFDPSGKTIYTQSIMQLEDTEIGINLNEAPTGMYYVQLKTEVEISTKKLILVK